MKKLTNKGFTLLESLFSLLILSLGISLLISIFPCIKKLSSYSLDVEEEIAFYKLRELMLLANDITFSRDQLWFFYMENDVNLTIENNRIVRSEGYVIYMEGVENAFFEKKESCYYLNYERNNEKKRRFLGCE